MEQAAQEFIWVLLPLLVAGCALWALTKRRSGHVGPRGWPLFGSLFEISRNRRRLYDWFLDEINKTPTSTMSFDIPGGHMVCTANPENVEYMLKTNFANFPKGSYVADRLSELLGTGIFNSDGDVWKRHRKIASFEFSSKKLRDYSTQSFQEDAVRLMNVLDTAARSETAVDFQDMVLRMTLDSICKIGFGADVGALHPSLPDIQFGRRFDSASEIVGYRQLVGHIWKLKRRFNIGSEKTLQGDIKIVRDFTTNIVDQRKEERSKLRAVGKDLEKADLLSRFMLFVDDDGSRYTDNDLKDAILNFIIAGRDTSAATLSWFGYVICNQPEICDKIFEEIRDVVGVTEGENYSQFAEKLTYEVLGRMHYLHAAMSETLRLYPPVPKDGKTAAAACVLPDGTRVPKGSQVLYLPHTMGRLRCLWGDDALEFKPERWLKDGVFQPQSPFKFTTFQAGPRICLGKDSAYLQIKITVALFVRFMRLRMLPNQDITYRLGIVMQILNGLHVVPVISHT